MTVVGFEPTKHDAGDLKSPPFDRSGTLPDFSWYILFHLKYESEMLLDVPLAALPLLRDGIEPPTPLYKNRDSNQLTEQISFHTYSS